MSMIVKPVEGHPIGLRARADNAGSGHLSSSEKFVAFCFALFCLIPYGFLPNFAVGAILFFISALCAALRPPKVVFRNPYFLVISLLILIQTALSLIDLRSFDFFFVQANSYWQFVVLYVAFSAIVRGEAWIVMLRSRMFLVLLLIASLIDIVPRVLRNDVLEVHIISLPLLMIFVRSFAFGRQKQNGRVVAALILTTIIGVLVTRATLLAVLLFYILFLLFYVPPKLTKTVATILLITPAVFYLVVGDDWIYYWQFNDFNTAIRAEFIRGAFDSFSSNLFTGVGFDYPYRDMYYPYVLDHVLLRDIIAVNTISNHNSFFDIGLRLGICALFALYGLVVLRPKISSSSSYKSFLLVFACLSMGSNASLEDQNEILSVIMAIAILNETGGFEKLRRLMPGPDS